MYIFLLTFLMKLQYMDTLTAFYPMVFNLMFDEFPSRHHHFSHPLQLCVHHFSKWFTTLNACNIIWCFIYFLNVFNILHMLQHKMFLEFLNAIPHSMHVTTMMFCKIPSQEQPFLAFYAYTWILLSFCGCVPKQFWFKLQSKNIDGNFVPIIFNSPAIRAKDLFLVQTWLCIGVS